MLLQRLIPLGRRGGSGGAFTVTVNPISLFFYSPTGGGSGTTPTVTATATGGTGPYTYAWTGAGKFTPTASGAATTAFTGTGVGSYSDTTEIETCTATDSTMATAFVTIPVQMVFGGQPPSDAIIKPPKIIIPKRPL